MKRFFIFVLAGALVVFACSQVENSQHAKSIKKIKSDVKELFNNSGLTGLSSAVIRNGEICTVDYYGVRNAAIGDPVDENTVFEAASLSKVVFSYLVLKLVDQGTLELDKPLLDYVDEDYIVSNFLKNPVTDDRFHQLTLRLVLSHRTGLPNWRFFDGDDAPLAFRRDPGLEFGYSGEGFQLAQTVIERISDKDLQQLAEEMVFEPLGMKHSCFVGSKKLLPNMALRTSLLGLIEEPDMDNEPPMMAAASLLTTAEDFARFLLALRDGTGISKDTFTNFYTPQVSISDDENEIIHWGLGVGLAGNTTEAPLWHWGNNGNARAFFMFDRISGNGVVFFSNDGLGLSIVADMVRLAGLDPEPVLNSQIMENYTQWDSTVLRMVRLVRENDIEGALEIQRLLMEDETQAEATESQVNLLGYLLLANERYNDAIKMFTINAEFNPESANVWDSLGEAYWRCGDLDNAELNYSKALELDPEFRSAKNALEQIGQERSENEDD